MVLEKLISLRDAIRSPFSVFLMGGITSVSCLFISFLVFSYSVGLFTTFLITIASTPFMLSLIKYEEATTEEEIEKKKEINFLKRHADILTVYVAFFTGIIFSLTIIYLILPESIVEKLFEDQIREINLIRGGFVFEDTLQRIVMNNISVLILSFLFSFLFGAGAIFILAWNASVLSAAIGLTAKSIGGLKGLPLAVLSFFPHGSLEILAYFIGAIAGGLISAAVTRRKSKFFWVVVRDSFMLLGVSVLLLVVAGVVEVVVIAV